MSLIASCHCGATKFEVSHAPESATSCNCTYCAKTGALWAYYKPEDLRIHTETGAAVYAPSGINKHHFCAQCGISTYGVTPDWSEADIGANTIPQGIKIGINIRLFDELDISAIPVHTIDGRNLW